MDKKIEDRVKEFGEAYGELVKKYRVDFANYPMFVPDEKGGFRVIIHSSLVDMDEYEKQNKDFLK